VYIRKSSLRFSSVFLVIILFLIFFTSKLIWIQFFRSSYLANRAEKQHKHGIKIEPKRGTIYDRKMRPLAVNVSVHSLFANPRHMTDEDKLRAIEKLSALLGLDKEFLKSRLGRKKYFVWLARKLDSQTAEEVRKLEIRGLSFRKESKRHYPNQYLAAHVIGYAGMDNKGLEGLELLYDRYLKGESGWTQILRDAKHRELLIEKEAIPARDGFNIILTIDETIQFIAEQALEKAFIKHNAKSASIIVMDPMTGEILALANRPTYDLTEFADSRAESRPNRAVVYVYEPGSVFKIVAATAALEEEVFMETDEIYCENGEYRIANHILHDSHPHGTLTFREVIEQSSNIGTTKIAQKLGASVFYKYAKRLGFGRKTGIDLIGEVSGLLKPPSQWSKTSIGALPIGQEVTVTPLQLVCAISCIANGGVYMKPYVVKYIVDNTDELIKKFEPEAFGRIISEDTAQRVKEILKGVVENGTGRRARIKGVHVAGKTGTAQKVIGREYSHNRFYASFVGFAPAEDPRVAAVVVFEEPHPSYYGGTVAAPVFREMMVDTLKYLEANDYN